MAFSFGNSGGAQAGNAGGAASGPELETIATEELGFLSVAGEAKVRLTSLWSPLPTPTASLLGVASRRGLVAAAGPDHVILATTESVRKALENPKEGESEIRSFQPQLKMPLPMRVSQLAFTADENYLILSAESGGGLAIYEVQSLLNGSTSSVFELPTNGESLRLLAPNPTSEKAELCAIVTTNGNLHMTNLKERKISNVLKSQVSSVSWSSRGKQLCAGLGDGTIHQMTPEGEAKAEIPKAPNLGNHHVSCLTWLENNLWLAIYTSNDESAPSSVYNIITRTPPSSFSFQKISDPIEPFGAEKAPHHSVLRLRDFPPDIQDLLIVASTASTDIGLLTRSKKALATDKPADSITGVFVTTELLDDSKRPTLPMTDSMDDSTPIGVALDLSSKDKVYKPIPSDEELEESPSPLPGLWVLTHEGVLCPWWLVYTDSIRKGTPYPGLASLDNSAPSQPPSTPFSSHTGMSGLGSTSTTTPTTTPAPAFGSSSQLGAKTSPWGAASTTTPTQPTATFGSSTFGSSPAPSAPAFGKPSTFGQSSQLGTRSSPWGAGAGSGSTPAFGQSGFSSFANKNTSTFGSGAQPPAQPQAPSSGGFASFSSQGGFSSVANNNPGGSIFASSGNQASGGSTSVFGSGSSGNTSFGAKTDKPSGGLFGQPFKLESSFKPDPTSAADNEKPSTTSGSSLFGSAFGSALNDAKTQPAESTKDEDMDAEDTTEQTPQAKPSTSIFGSQTTVESTTPTTTPAPPKFGIPSTAPGKSIFGQPSIGLGSGGGLFGSKNEPAKSSPFGGLFAQKKQVEPETPESKPGEQEPLPPDTTSKLVYPLGDSSSSSATSNAPTASSQFAEAPLPPDPVATPKPTKDGGLKEESSSEKSAAGDAPLPPDFVKVSKPKESSVVPEAAPLPPDFAKPSKTPTPQPPSIFSEANVPNTSFKTGAPTSFPSFNRSNAPPALDDDEDESDFEDDNATEGSGVDVAKDLSPSASGLGQTSTPGFTPQSSFGGVSSSVTSTAIDRSKPLFGELSRNAPLFPRPNAGSPRSPSPVRAIPGRMLRNDTRSVSAPGMASQIVGHQTQSQLRGSITSRETNANAEDHFLAQNRKLRARQEAEETQPLVDEEDDEVQKILASEVDGTLALDEFIAHTNTGPPAGESIPSQVEAVYRDINSMIDTVGLNARSVKAFVKGHTENRKEGGRTKEDLEIPDDWVLCEVDELGRVLEDDLYGELENGRVRNLEEKIEACQDLTRDMHRLRAKQEDLKKIIAARLDPDQKAATQSLPLSAEQATQQNELRRDFTNFSKLLAETEETLTLLKAKLASVSGTTGRGNTNMPTVDAVMRTITKMTSMVEKRSGDIDVLENQLRKVRLSTPIREGSPAATPQNRRSVLFSPDSTPARTLRHSYNASVGSIGSPARATPRKKLSGFSKEEKGDLMDKRARRQAVLDKLKSSVEKKGVSVWNMEDIE
ncbi:unnamed protein product [Clonostachys chloroleuca]|uniref:Nucleoporin Nup159/Nup146 N-terminal domain-containing protein n=1 Tax=Clonostachys chloroleuca TaxID=1926264 RepID=A0AA35Q956_9HYPO|nr:unnamed protein product [Clonostachys chloroleuca]